MRGEDDVRAFWDAREVVDEDRTTRLEVADDMRVVDDLLADVDSAPVERQGSLDRLDSPFDARAVASRRGEKKAFHHGSVTIALAG